MNDSTGDGWDQWKVAHNDERLEFNVKILDGGTTGQDIYCGRFHGDVIIHRFSSEERYYIAYDRFLKFLKDFSWTSNKLEQSAVIILVKN